MTAATMTEVHAPAPTGGSRWRLLYGAGWILGSLLAILLIGWILSLMGVIPGLDRIATGFQAAFIRVGR